MGEIVVISLFILAVILAYLLHVAFEREISRIHHREMERLSDLTKNISNPSKEYKFFTDGHPYVWVNSSYDEMVKGIRDSCRGPKGVPIQPVYSLMVSDENRKVYYIVGDKKFNFSKLVHYDKWLASKKILAENIAKYKGS
jgi:hypothetical protein